MKTFGEKLKEFRGNKKQKIFAEDDLQIQQAYLSELETNKKNPGRELLERLCSLSGRDMNYWTGIGEPSATVINKPEQSAPAQPTQEKQSTPGDLITQTAQLSAAIEKAAGSLTETDAQIIRSLLKRSLTTLEKESAVCSDNTKSEQKTA